MQPKLKLVRRRKYAKTWFNKSMEKFLKLSEIYKINNLYVYNAHSLIYDIAYF